jgi:hypothetical protein
MNCGLILNQYMGLLQNGGDFLVSDLFFNRKSAWTESMAHGPQQRWSMVDRPPWPATELVEARLSGRSRARWPAGGGAMERGVHGESISGLTGAQAAVWRPGDSGEETAEEALGVGSARAWREEKESGEMCGGGWRGSLFI